MRARTASHRSLRLRALVLLAALPAAAAASAQDTPRSPTGRHRPPPPAVRRAATAPPTGGRWFFTVGAGALDGGDLFRVETLDGLPVTWQAVNGGSFRTERFRTTLEPGPAVALGLGYRLGRRLVVRGDLAWTRADVAAEAALGEHGAVYTFDRFGLLAAGLSLEARLTRGAFAPYVSLGASLVRLAPDGAEDLGRTNLGGGRPWASPSGWTTWSRSGWRPSPPARASPSGPGVRWPRGRSSRTSPCPAPPA